MRLPKFTHKTPGFGITRNTYITVLAAQAALPSIAQIVTPKGRPPKPSHLPDTAVEGFGVPLSPQASKEDLDRPLMRGAYAISSKDRKAVLRMLVLSKEEAGFDPTPFLRSDLAGALDPETVARVSATWTLMQLTFESHDPMVYDSVRFLIAISARLADLTGGVVADPISRTYKLPLEAFYQPQIDPKLDARDVVHVWHAPHSQGGEWVYTLGMQKFGLAELEIFAVPEEYTESARSFLISLCQKALMGDLYALGDRVGSRNCPFQVGPGGLDRGAWEGIECHELIPPTSKTVGDCLAAWRGDQ